MLKKSTRSGKEKSGGGGESDRDSHQSSRHKNNDRGRKKRFHVRVGEITEIKWKWGRKILEIGKGLKKKFSIVGEEHRPQKGLIGGKNGPHKQANR